MQELVNGKGRRIKGCNPSRSILQARGQLSGFNSALPILSWYGICFLSLQKVFNFYEMETLVRLKCNLSVITFVVSLLPPLPSLFLPFLLTSLSKYLLPFYFFYQNAIRNMSKCKRGVRADRPQWQLEPVCKGAAVGGVRKLATFRSRDDGNWLLTARKGRYKCERGKLKQSL